MLLGPFALLKVLTPPERPIEREITSFDTIQMLDNRGSDLGKIEHLINDRATIAIIKAGISPCCDGQIDWNGRIWTAISFEDAVFEENEFVRVVAVHQLTCIVKKLPRSLCPAHNFN